MYSRGYTSLGLTVSGKLEVQYVNIFPQKGAFCTGLHFVFKRKKGENIKVEYHVLIAKRRGLQGKANDGRLMGLELPLNSHQLVLAGVLLISPHEQSNIRLLCKSKSL